MAKNALASEDLAKKFAKEKETPYTRWIKAEGLDIIPALYVAQPAHGRLEALGRGAVATRCSSTTTPRASRMTAT